MNLDQKIWQIIIILTVLLAAMAWLALVWWSLHRLTGRWQGRFLKRTGEIQAALKTIQLDLARLDQASRSYSSADPEPYGSRARRLHQLLTRAHQAYNAQTEQLSELSQNRLTYPLQSPAWLWFGFWTEPRYWRLCCQAAEKLWLSTQEPRRRVDQAGQWLESLQRLPLTTAQRSQKLYAVNDEILHLIQTLYLSGLQGQAIDTAADQAKQLEGRLKNLPVHFFQPADSQIIVDADKQSTILAWQTLTEIEAPLYQLQEQVQGWQTEYLQAGRCLQAMRRSVETARLNLNQVPAGIDVSSHLAELEQAGIEADELEARYRSPAVDILAELVERMLGVTEVAGWLSSQADTLAAKLSQLRALMASTTDLLAQSGLIMAETGQVGPYQLAWSTSQVELQRLREARDGLGAVDKARTPAELEKHLVIAGQLAAQAQALRNSLVEVKMRRDRLAPLLEQAELAAEPAWLEQANRLYTQISPYNSKNWPDGEAADRVWEHARQLAEQQENLRRSKTGQPLAAEEIGLYLNEVQRLLADIEAFQARLQRLEDTVNSLQQIEAGARQQVDVILTAIEPLLDHLEAIDFVVEPAVAGRQQQLEKLEKEGHKLAAALDRPKSGLIADKERRVSSWSKECAAVLQALQTELLVQGQTMTGRLQAELQALQEVARFDQERIVREAGQLAAQSQALSPEMMLAGGSDRHQIELLVEQMIASLNRAKTLHQVRDRLKSQIEDRIAPRRQRLHQVQQEARAATAALERSLAENSWPPVSYDQKSLKQFSEQAETGLASLQQSGQTVRQALAGLETAIERYEDILDRARRAVTEIKREQNRLQAILDELDRWQRQLELYRARHYEDAALVKAINQRLNSLTEKRAEAHRPHLSFDQVEHMLKKLEQMAYEDLRVDRDGQTEIISRDQIE